MNIHEYQAKAVLKEFGVPISRGVPILKASEAEAAAKEEKTMEFVENLEVPYSTGRSVPTIAMPENACDCAHHIYDPVRFPYKPSDTRNQPPAGVDVYRLLQKKLGMTRSVGCLSGNWAR